MFCENCGAKLKKEDKFCPECGQPVLNYFEENEEFCPEEDTWNLADSGTNSKTDVFDWDDNSYKVPEAPLEESKNKTVRWIVIVGSSVAILMLVSVLIFNVLKGNFVSHDSDIQVRTEKIQTLPGNSKSTGELSSGEEKAEVAKILTPVPTSTPVPTVTPEAVVTPTSAPEVQIPVQAPDDGHQPDFAEKTQPVVAEAENPAGEDYILPQSASVYLTLQDIEGLTREELFYARNEIYARHGRKFLDDSIQAYFNEKSWYTPLYEAEDFDARQDSFFNDYEKKNAEFILKYEKSKGYL